MVIEDWLPSDRVKRVSSASGTIRFGSYSYKKEADEDDVDDNYKTTFYILWNVIIQSELLYVYILIYRDN